ncbi:MAG: hypothetical protein ACHQ1H_02895 [Nitrososphaerales archaeon]
MPIGHALQVGAQLSNFAGLLFLRQRGPLIVPNPLTIFEDLIIEWHKSKVKDMISKNNLESLERASIFSRDTN